MEFEPILAAVSKYIVGAGGIVAVAFGVFRFLGTKWLDAKFNERLQTLKAAEDRSVRHIQSTIDREIHRAKKLYDNEFTALSECWKLLRVAYDLSAATIASLGTAVERFTDEELDRHLSARGMAEWKQREVKAKTGKDRADEYHVWSEWERYKTVDEAWRKFRSYLDANSIFFADGFSERFRAIEALIIGSNVEFEDRIREYGRPRTRDAFEFTKKLRTEGEPLMKELEQLVRKRIWSVDKGAEGSAQ